MITTYQIPCLDLEQIAVSGQCFRMIPTQDGRYQIISQGKLLRISQDNSLISFDCPEDERSFWLDYFDYGRDYEAILKAADPRDDYLNQAVRAGSGIRILNQDPWEMIITFVISQQKTIPKIRELVEAICSRWGSPLAGYEGCYGFPSPEQLARASLEELTDMKLGYRARYIYRLSQDAFRGTLDLTHLKKLDYKASMEYLTGFYGIGKKVANCVCLFGLHHIDAFPVDTWIEKILMEHYFDPLRHKDIPSRLCDSLVQESFGRYEGFAGVMQQYIFHFERNVKNRT